jgi:DNA-binding transcriptional regulator YiaG
MSDTVVETGAGVDELLSRVRARRTLPPAAERRRIREAAGVSMREMARALGTSLTNVQRWEEGARPRKYEAAYARLLEELRRLAA